MRKKISNKSIFLICSFGIIFFTGCAFDLVHVKQIPIQFNSNQPSKKSFKLVNDTKVRLGTGYSRHLKSGTRWDYVGAVKHGDVYKTKDQILTVEGSNIFEAYIVVSEDNIVGFYLPAEKSYSPLTTPQKLQVEVINPN